MCSNQQFTSLIPWVTTWNWGVTKSKARVARLKARVAKLKAQAEAMESQVK